ncbi:MAG: hydantoinase/carbamoylase family amidase [Clostridia bacterium]|nr:hydantoinase/carbamoylase family amidase [Deltaproteobacteria bacterium]
MGAYLEVHIEQGPVLEVESLALGVVETIVGQSRLVFTFVGSANHAGTTPMELRRDAVAAAAEWVTHVEATARAINTLVATVGRFEVSPNAANVIAGEVLASLDVRHPSDTVRRQVVAALIAKADLVAASRRVTVSVESRLDQPAAPMDERLTAILERAVRSVGVSPLRMRSGAGHDAMVIAPVVPSTMLFVRTPAGLSHHPDETVIVRDVELAVRSTLAFVEALAEEKLHA